MATVYLIAAFVIALFAVIFALQNTMTVTISLLAWEATGTLSLVLLITLAMGVIIGLLVLAPSTIRYSFTASSHRKRIGVLEKELDERRARVVASQKPVTQPTEDPKHQM
jgi:uncharacterized integral membrane protein